MPEEQGVTEISAPWLHVWQALKHYPTFTLKKSMCMITPLFSYREIHKYKVPSKYTRKLQGVVYAGLEQHIFYVSLSGCNETVFLSSCNMVR